MHYAALFFVIPGFVCACIFTRADRWLAMLGCLHACLLAGNRPSATDWRKMRRWKSGVALAALPLFMGKPVDEETLTVCFDTPVFNDSHAYSMPLLLG